MWIIPFLSKELTPETHIDTLWCSAVYMQIESETKVGVVEVNLLDTHGEDSQTVHLAQGEN